MKRAHRAGRLTYIDISAIPNAVDQEPWMDVGGDDELSEQYQRGRNRSDAAPAIARISDCF